MVATTTTMNEPTPDEVIDPEAVAKKKVLSTGHPEIDKKLGGGIPMGSLILVEGESDAGKSVLCQQIMWDR